VLRQESLEHGFCPIRDHMAAHQFAHLTGHPGARFDGRTHAGPTSPQTIMVTGNLVRRLKPQPHSLASNGNHDDLDVPTLAPSSLL
jgi:hypothetical protein